MKNSEKNPVRQNPDFINPFNVKLMLFALIAVLFGACDKIDNLSGGGSSTAATNYYVDMTDAPGNFDQVNVNIKSVYAVTSKGEVSLNVNSGIYNLLDFRNGVDTLIATGGLGNTTVSQIRLVLGDGNTVMVDSAIYPLTVPSGMQSGVKLDVHNELKAGVAYHLLLDFDANASVVLTGNGKYLLKPVIRVIDTAMSGSIKGLVLPVGVNVSVKAEAGGIVYTGSANLQGEFIIQGLPAGVYDVTIDPAAPYLPVTQTGVVVVKGECTNIGTVVL
jgi:hypothetical protein